MYYSTNAIFGKQELGLVFAEDYIDWAGEMLKQGHDSTYLRILSLLKKSTALQRDYFEAAGEYFRECVEELNLEAPAPEAAMLAYASEVAQQIVNGELSGTQGVRLMYQIYIASDYDRDFFLIWLRLDDALDSLLSDSYPITYEEATLENIDSIAKDEAKKFIALITQRTAT